MINPSRQMTPMMWFTVLLVIAGALALLLPPDPHTLHQLHISSVAYRVAIAALLLPYALIWYMGFYAFAKLQEYTQYIKDSKEGRAFRSITRGMGVLAFGLILPTILSLILGYITQSHTGFKAADTVINDYIGLLLIVVAFTYMNNGSHALVVTTKARANLMGGRFLAVLFLVLSTTYTYLVIHAQATGESSYHLNTFWLITTFIIPYLYTWFAALSSAFEFKLYAKAAKGLLYKRGLAQFASGITIAIVGSVIIQFVQSTFAAWASNALGSLLIVEYVLLLIVAAGLIVMANGTRKLKKIEEV